jgi:hypothetical protein
MRAAEMIYRDAHQTATVRPTLQHREHNHTRDQIRARLRKAKIILVTSPAKLSTKSRDARGTERGAGRRDLLCGSQKTARQK